MIPRVGPGGSSFQGAGLYYLYDKDALTSERVAFTHIHVILNRVHPEHGRAASTSKDHLKLSKWAEGYERDHGGIRCHQRVNHNARRDRGQFVKNTNLTREEYDWVKQHRSLAPEAIREARSERQEKDAAELKRDFTRRQNALERDLRRDYAKPKANLERQIGTTEERIGKKGFFRAVVRKLTGAERRDQVSLKALKGSLQQIETRMEERRDALKQGYARDWEKMERRHGAERERDERLIERKRTEGSRGRAGEIARKSFRERAGGDAARHSPTPSDRKRMSEALSKSARMPETEDGQKKRRMSEERSDQSKRAKNGMERRRNRPRSRDRDKGFERE